MKKKIIGKWQFVCWKVNAENGWEQLEGYSEGQFAWNFGPDEVLIKSTSGWLSSATKYYICPDKSFLGIDRSDYAHDGFINACMEDHYRVEFLSDLHMILYDLEDVEVEPDQYMFRMELEKLQNPSG